MKKLLFSMLALVLIIVLSGCEALQSGQAKQAGILGTSLTSNDIFTTSVECAASNDAEKAAQTFGGDATAWKKTSSGWTYARPNQNTTLTAPKFGILRVDENRIPASTQIVTDHAQFFCFDSKADQTPTPAPKATFTSGKMDGQQTPIPSTSPIPSKGGILQTPEPQPQPGKGGPITSDISCPTTGEIKGMLSLDVVREGTEFCGFEWRGIPFSSKVNVPGGFFATLHLTEKDAKGNDRIVLIDGDKNPDIYEIFAGTFRWKKGYPTGDPARDNYEGLLAKEQNFGRVERPTFNVVPFGSGSQPSAGSSGSGGADPSTALGGTWNFTGGNQWTLTGAATIHGAAGWIIHTPNHPRDPGLPVGQQETTSVATAYKVQ